MGEQEFNNRSIIVRTLYVHILYMYMYMSTTTLMKKVMPLD